MSRHVLILSGPNLDQLGFRDPALYGTMTLEKIIEMFRGEVEGHDIVVLHRQSNFEGDLVSAIHDARAHVDALVINAGALTHTSWSLRDALEIYPGLKVEVHLSNPAGRESFRHTSTIAPVVQGSIAGFGAEGYRLAAQYLLHQWGL